MASPHAIRELRFVSGTSFNTAFTAASNAAWNPGTATKMRVTGYDPSGLEYSGVADPTLKQRRYAMGPTIPTTRMGSFTFSTYIGGAESGVTANPVATLMDKICGNIILPNARTITLDDSGSGGGVHTTIKIYSDATNGFADELTNVALLCGTRGDGRGNGEVRRITGTGSEGTSEYADLNMATSGTMQDTDVCVVSTAVHLDPDEAQEYLDFLVLGNATEDQRQMIGCQGGFELTSLGVDEAPQVNFTMNVADWQWVPSADRDSIDTSSAVQGNNPPVNKGLGGLFFGDAAVTTRNVFKGGDVSLPSFFNYTATPDLNGVNGVGGWTKMPSTPTCEFSLLFAEDMDGLYSDYANEATTTGAQAKQLIIQWGHEAQRCFAVDMPNCYLSGDPKQVELNGLSAVRLTVHGDQGTGTSNDLQRSPIVFHWF